jgi:hypothetical protein
VKFDIDPVEERLVVALVVVGGLCAVFDYLGTAGFLGFYADY